MTENMNTPSSTDRLEFGIQKISRFCLDPVVCVGACRIPVGF